MFEPDVLVGTVRALAHSRFVILSCVLQWKDFMQCFIKVKQTSYVLRCDMHVKTMGRSEHASANY